MYEPKKRSIHSLVSLDYRQPLQSHTECQFVLRSSYARSGTEKLYVDRIRVVSDAQGIEKGISKREEI